MHKIRVGIIGASPDRGWAKTAHIPALRALPDYELTAVGTSRRESADEAARTFGVAHAFTDARQLAVHPEVDLVVVTVKVPYHQELAEAALAAGKHLLVEWPLARTTEEARTLAEHAREAGVRTAIGLQARFSPAVNYARQLIADGYVGRVTSANLLVARGKGATEEMPGWTVYTLDQANAAGIFEVSGGHTLDAVEYILGQRLTAVSARTSIQRPHYTIAETGEQVTATSPDQILLHAGLTGGGVVSGHLHDAKITEGRTRLEIGGTAGDLVIQTSGSAGPMGIQIAELRLRGGSGIFEDLPVPASYQRVPAGIPAVAVLNVAQMYAALADDTRTGNSTVPDFSEGLRLHRLLDAIKDSATDGLSPRPATGPVARTTYRPDRNSTADI